VLGGESHSTGAHKQCIHWRDMIVVPPTVFSIKVVEHDTTLAELGISKKAANMMGIER